MSGTDPRLEEALRSVGDDYLRRNPADFAAARQKLDRLHRRRRWRMGALTVVSGAAVVALGLYVWPSTDPIDRSIVRPAGPRVTSQVVIDVGDGPTEVAAGHGAIWVSNTEEGSVSRIDPASNEQIAKVDVTGSPGDLAVADDGAVWVANPELGAVQRIASASNARVPDVMQPVGPESTPLDLAIDDEFLWVSVVGRELVQLDATSGEEIRRIGDLSPVNVAAREGRVFVLESDGTVVELDPGTGERAGSEWSFEVSDRGDVHFYAGRLWVAEGDGSVLYSADASDPSAAFESYEFPGEYLEMIHTPLDVVLLSDTGGGALLSSVVRAGAQPFDGVDLTGGQSDLVQGSGSLWISNRESDTVTRIESVPGVGGG